MQVIAKFSPSKCLVILVGFVIAIAESLQDLWRYHFDLSRMLANGWSGWITLALLLLSGLFLIVGVTVAWRFATLGGAAVYLDDRGQMRFFAHRPAPLASIREVKAEMRGGKPTGIVTLRVEGDVRRQIFGAWMTESAEEIVANVRSVLAEPAGSRTDSPR